MLYFYKYRLQLVINKDNLAPSDNLINNVQPLPPYVLSLFYREWKIGLKGTMNNCLMMNFKHKNMFYFFQSFQLLATGFLYVAVNF